MLTRHPRREVGCVLPGRYSRVRWLVAFMLLVGLAAGCMEDDPVGDAARGAALYATGDRINPNPGCDTCHCPDARGGCQVLSSPPNIQGASFELISDKTRDPQLSHTGGKFAFDNQDVADIEAFLATFVQ